MDIMVYGVCGILMTLCALGIVWVIYDYYKDIKKEKE